MYIKTKEYEAIVNNNIFTTIEINSKDIKLFTVIVRRVIKKITIAIKIKLNTWISSFIKDLVSTNTKYKIKRIDTKLTKSTETIDDFNLKPMTKKNIINSKIIFFTALKIYKLF